MLLLTGDIVRKVAKNDEDELAFRDFLNRIADDLNNALSAYQVSTCHLAGEDFPRVEELTGIKEKEAAF